MDLQERARLLGLPKDSTPEEIEQHRRDLIEALGDKFRTAIDLSSTLPSVQLDESPELRALVESEQAGDHERAYRIALGMLVDFDTLRAEDTDGLVALSNEYEGSYERYRKAYLRGEK